MHKLDEKIYYAPEVDEPDLLARVRDLERNLGALKVPPGGGPGATGFVALCKRFPRLLVANWVLLSFLGGAFVAIYVKRTFDIDPFESYRSAAANRNLSDFHTKMGDKMMGRSEWKAAERDYRDALQLNPHNEGATFGLVKAQVLQPLPGERSYAGEVVDERLRLLGTLRPRDGQIDFLKAVRFIEMDEDVEAAKALNTCIEKDPKFAGCYINLAFIDVRQGRIAEAEAKLERVVVGPDCLDSDLPIGMSSLASIYLHLEKYAKAAALLERSYRISPHAISAFTLGQVYWYLGRFDDALQIHQVAVDWLAQDQDEQDRYGGGLWASVYLPLHTKDLDTIKISVPVNTLKQKVTLFHFELAIDHALLGQVDDAKREFTFALKSQPPKEHLQLIQNRIQSIINMVSISDVAKQWLGEYQQRLN